MYTLGIDYGKARIGIAISDANNAFARSLMILKNKGDEEAIERIVSLSKEKSINTIVVGMPLGSNAQNTQMSDIIGGFIGKLHDALPENITIVEWNETLTSYQAYENLLEKGLAHPKIKEQLDSEAARIILQEYLDRS